uniref:Uncharacterized protein n=1 Tax=Arundo donax TaxID=35708 RepID=A0A0A8Z9M9_ARUDO
MLRQQIHYPQSKSLSPIPYGIDHQTKLKWDPRRANLFDHRQIRRRKHTKEKIFNIIVSSQGLIALS